MEIELKNIQTYERLSEETNAFTADIYINGQKAGTAKNSGHGGMTDYRHENEAGKDLIEKAEAWCKKQPPDIIKDETIKGGQFKIEITLDYIIDKLVDAHLQEKQLAQFHKRLEKGMVNSIIYGVPGGTNYSQIKFKLPIRDILNDILKKEFLKDQLHKKVLPRLKGNMKIVNNNISAEEWVELGVPKDKLSPLELTPHRKKQPGKRIDGPDESQHPKL